MTVNIISRVNGNLNRYTYEIEDGCAYIEINGFTYYVDDTAGEPYIIRYETDVEDAAQQYPDWKNINGEFKFLKEK